MSSYSSGRKRKMLPPQTTDKQFVTNQIVWVKVKGHQIWPGTIVVLPPQAAATGSKSKFECNFFNNTDKAYVPAGGLFDFVKNFNTFAPKQFKRCARDKAVIDAMMELDDDVLVDARLRTDIAPLLEEAQAKQLAENLEEAAEEAENIASKSSQENPEEEDCSEVEHRSKSENSSTYRETQENPEEETKEEAKSEPNNKSATNVKSKAAIKRSLSTTQLKTVIGAKRQTGRNKKANLTPLETNGQKIRKSVGKPDMQPLVDLPEEQLGSSGGDVLQSSKSQDEARTDGGPALSNIDLESVELLSVIQDNNTQTVEIQSSSKQALVSPQTAKQALKLSKNQLEFSKKSSLLGKRRFAPQKTMAMLQSIEVEHREDAGTAGRRWSLEESTQEKKEGGCLGEGTGANKDALQLVNINAWTECGKSKMEMNAGTSSALARYSKSKKHTSHLGAQRELLNLQRVNDFLRLLIENHQRTVKQLAKNPEAKNPARSFDQYLRHLKLVKRISEHIWDNHDWYTASLIVESRVMKGLWIFVCYCEAYREDCQLLNRAHVLLFLIIQMFQSIINNSVRRKHKNSFKKQRMSMLPTNKAVSMSGNNQTANSFSDRHSMVSGSALLGHQEPSDVELSLGAGGPPSEGGSLFDAATQLNNAQASDDRRELDLAYKDLYNQIHGKGQLTSQAAGSCTNQAACVPQEGTRSAAIQFGAKQKC